MRHEAINAGAAVVALWAVLMAALIWARPRLKRRETWRAIMAGLVGLGATFERRRRDDGR